MQHACECSLKCLDSEMEFIYWITKDICSRCKWTSKCFIVRVELFGFLTVSKSGRLPLLSLLLAFLFMRSINELCLHYQTTCSFSKLFSHCIWTMHHTVLPTTYNLSGSIFHTFVSTHFWEVQCLLTSDIYSPLRHLFVTEQCQFM